MHTVALDVDLKLNRLEINLLLPVDLQQEVFESWDVYLIVELDDVFVLISIDIDFSVDLCFKGENQIERK